MIEVKRSETDKKELNVVKYIKDFKTCELVEELRKREGVKVRQAEPYEGISIDVSGPAVVLIVTD